MLEAPSDVQRHIYGELISKASLAVLSLDLGSSFCRCIAGVDPS
jgi:hypothetical protein